MRCEDIMKRNVAYVSTADTAQHAAQKMRHANVGFLPVCTADRHVVGTITDRDLALRLVAEGRNVSTPIGELMTHEAVTCRPTDDLHRAEQIMSTHRKSRILCIDEQRQLVGVISLSDIAQYEESDRAGRIVRNVTEREAF
jgi:CBS domain-containing protein